ncbi:helix-turn-helix domain-containing protein [Pendulispora rubella]|uniref:Helix-turn-helix domain-containing protein n=1 Tax=Pendulispora rubella TaxID=2741070 RepID=A0ABZ2KUV7_9BACT
MVARAPKPHLRPFVQVLWASDGTAAEGHPASEREYMLPTGAMHLVFCLGRPLRLYDDLHDPTGHTVGHALVGGARSTFYVRDVSRPSRSVGAQFQPGAAELLLGVPASALSGRHTRLEDLWGRVALDYREQLLEARSPEVALDRFESLLTARLAQGRALHPCVAGALELFADTADVRAVVDASGYSHRRFIALFREAVGLTPKVFCRIQRFQRALAWVASAPDASWADLALRAGYADQAHFNRDFREFSGISPGIYRELAPVSRQHVPIPRTSSR